MIVEEKKRVFSFITKFLRISFFLLSITIILFFIVVYWGLSDKTGTGTVNNLKDLPYVGKYLTELKTEGVIRYKYIWNYRGVRILFTGNISKIELQKICTDGFFSYNREEKLKIWFGRLKEFGVSQKNYPIGSTSEDFSFVLKRDKDRINIVFTYSDCDSRFTALAYL